MTRMDFNCHDHDVIDWRKMWYVGAAADEIITLYRIVDRMNTNRSVSLRLQNYEQIKTIET